MMKCMTLKRIFVAINFDRRICDRIEKDFQSFESDIPEILRLGMKVVLPENRHITLSFLGDQEVSLIPHIIEALQGTTQNFSAPEICIEKLCYGPTHGPARMIWALASRETSIALRAVKAFLEKQLEDRGVVFKKEHRAFFGHVTVTRFTTSVPDMSRRPILDRAVNCAFVPKSLDLMESELKRGGPEYHLLQAAPFRDAE
jgi:2'-5' RNA ligase